MTTNDEFPEEMHEALKAVRSEARAMIEAGTKALETATAWSEGREAYDFASAGNYGRTAGDLEAAIATFRAYRSVAWKLQGFARLQAAADEVSS